MKYRTKQAPRRRRLRRRRRVLRLEQFEARRLLAADVEGPDGPPTEDVNGDGKVTAADALMIINMMNRWRLGDQTPGPAEMDVNGDGSIGATDCLQIINRMRRDRLGQPDMPSGHVQEIRSIDGTGNNLDHPLWGSAEIELVRIVDAAYADGIDEPSGVDRPSPRWVSNLVAAQSDSMPNAQGLTDFAWQWGQFIDHDMDLTREGHGETFNIPVPTGDPWFDPDETGMAEIRLGRSGASDDSGTGTKNPRQQVNDITAYIDGSMIYGSNAERAAELRAFSGGRLKTSEGDLLPFNEAGLPNAGQRDEPFFLAGDVRANEQVGLTSMHTLWVREHNRIADSIAAENALLTDEAVYQIARAIVIGELQAITFNEYLPAILGRGTIQPYEGYDPSVDPGISNLFATACYRYGHTQLPTDLMRLDDEGNEIDAGHLPLRDAFFNPEHIMAEGIDSVLKGLATGVAQEIDTHVVDDVRNFLFGPPGAGGFDLASLNIQRGRDHGLPDYNRVRVQLGLGRVESFDEITSDPELQQALEQAYESVDKIDVWVGGLAEDHVRGANVGPLIQKVLSEQFMAIRDGDRFWYENAFSGDQLEQIRQTRLSDVIERNTDLTSIQRNVFYAPDYGPPLASGH